MRKFILAYLKNILYSIISYFASYHGRFKLFVTGTPGKVTNMSKFTCFDTETVLG